MSEDDATLLRRYAKEKSEEAFATLVRRHLDLVYAVALRQVGGDAHLAQDVAQTVFTALARKAASLGERPVLGGWLYRTTQFTAIDAVRGESRRRAREWEAQTMHEFSTNPGATIDWDRLRPTLDRAIGELNDDDRDAVVLRFFEGKSFADVGARLRLNENSARMRVERALDKLHGLLARHGVTSTTAALGVALANQPSIAAPAGLAASVTGAALAGSWVAGAGATAAAGGLLAFMSTSKIILGGAAALAVLGIGAAVYQTSEVKRQEVSIAAAAADQAALAVKVRDLEARVAAESKRAQAADDDNAKLLKVIEGMQAARATRTAETAVTATAEPDVPVTQAVVDSRYKHAQDLARSGNFAEALKEFLWCYDKGMPQVASYTGVRSSFLLSEIAKLGENYPPALAALRERRDDAGKRMLTDAADNRATTDFSAINRTLHESQSTIEIYDQLPLDDRRRRSLASAAYDQLLESRRYADAIVGRPYASMNSLFDSLSKERPLPATISNPEMVRESQRRSLIAFTSANVEVLAGAGDLAHAQELAGKLLAIDSSDYAKSVLQQHAARAGHPELFGGAAPAK